jgi:RNA polymerase sigma-70 factor (ECF subfamily)
MGRVVPLARPQPAFEALDDASLLAVCASGNRDAVTVFFRRFVHDVSGFLSRLLGHGHPDLDDVIQLTFLAAVDAGGRYARQSTVRSWLLGVAAHQAHTHLRSRRRRREAVDRLAEVPPQPGEDPEGRAQHRQELRRLEQAVAELPEDHRAAFLLCEVEEVPGPEAAGLLGVKLGTLWRRLSETRARLRAALGKRGPLRTGETKGR